MQKTNRRGFTLIELLVVIAIIGILASIVLASLDSARKKGRDARRLADIKQIQLALELYYDANGVYPPTILGTVMTAPGYISVLPTDPLSGSTVYNYSYAPLAATSGSTICSSYHLGADLEVYPSSNFNSDADTTTLTAGTGETNNGLFACAISGATADFHGSDVSPNKCNSADPGVACYDVRP